MKTYLKFSAVLPIYKKVNFKIFVRSLESILKQSYQPDELLIVFDGPVKGDIRSIIERKKKKFKYIRTINLPFNYGLGRALNLAIKKSKYNYIARCDADDISHINRFREQIQYMHKNKNIDVLGSNIVEIFNNKKNSFKHLPKKHFLIEKLSYLRNPINHSSVIFKKKIIIKAGNYIDMPFFEDYFLWMRVLKCGGKFHNIQKNLVFMNTDLDYFTRRSGLKYFKFYLSFLFKLREHQILSLPKIIINILVRMHIVYLPATIIKKLYNLVLR